MRRFIIVSVVCIFVIAPGLAKLASMLGTQSTQPQQQQSIRPLTVDEVRVALAARNKSLPLEKRFNSNLIVESVKKMQTWWYIATVKINGFSRSVIVSKFSNDDIVVVADPKNSLPYYNISNGLGVPYDVIEEFNNSYRGV